MIHALRAGYLQRGKRDALDPYTGRHYQIPANMTYNEWYREYVENNQNMAQPEYGERNLTRIQYENYRKRLGKSFDMTYEEFIDMKTDKDLWAAYQRSYKASRKSDKYTDMTDVYNLNYSRNESRVEDSDHYTTPTGKRYSTNDNGVYLDYKPDGAEIREAPILSRATGQTVKMCPRVTGENMHVCTPDYLLGNNEARWDHKTLNGSGSNALRKRIVGSKGHGRNQAENYLVNIDNWKGSQSDIMTQVEKMFVWSNTEFVNELIIVRDGVPIRALVRK